MAIIHPPQTRVHIRWMIRRDMPEVLAIEQGAFDRPWTEEEFLRALRRRNCIGMVAEHGDRIVGFVVYELHRGRLELLRVAVDHRWTFRGIGRQMVAKLVGKLTRQPGQRNHIATLVRETNLEGQLFLRACGFRAERVERGAWDDTGEDGFRMVYRIGEES